MKKKIIYALLIVFSGLMALLLFIVLEDLTYDDFEVVTTKEENRKALVIIWEANDQDIFWSDYENQIHPVVKKMYDQGAINLVLSYSHKPLVYRDSELQWTNCTVVMLNDTLSYLDISASLMTAIKKSSLQEHFRAMDLMKLQQGIDMFYPVKNGIQLTPGMQQDIEYVFSKPETRTTYYQDQYQFSAPAMGDLHSRDKTGRFIGFELEKRIASVEQMPEWDVIHIIGFTNWQTIKALPFFYSTWNKHAERVYGEGMTLNKRLAEWEKIRDIIKTATKQNFSMTIEEHQQK